MGKVMGGQVAVKGAVRPHRLLKLAEGDKGERLVQRWLMDQRANLADALGACESPIEVMLGVTLLTAGDAVGPFLRLCDPKPGARVSPLAKGRGGALYAQYPARLEDRAIRIDFALVTPEKRLAIEVDGHAFHATKAAARADKSRDRGLVGKDWIPIRFTGSEIHGNAERCAAEVLRLVGLTPCAPPVEQLVIAGTELPSVTSERRPTVAETRAYLEEFNRNVATAKEGDVIPRPSAAPRRGR